MLLTDEEVQERLESPLNLMNRLRNASKAPSKSPCLPPNSDDLNLDIDEKVAVTKLRGTAASIMALSLHELKQRIPEIQKPEKLAQIAAEMNKVLISRQDDKDKSNQPQIIVYAPQIIQESHFQQINLQDEI